MRTLGFFFGGFDPRLFVVVVKEKTDNMANPTDILSLKENLLELSIILELLI
jgi:hypothetical protein